jgi:hypothetical protein
MDTLLIALCLGAALLLGGLLILQRRKPEEADKVAATADGLWKRVLAKLRRK